MGSLTRGSPTSPSARAYRTGRFTATPSARGKQWGVLHMLPQGGCVPAAPPPLGEGFRKPHRRYLEEYRKEARIMGVIEQVSRYDEEVRATRLDRQKLYILRAEAAIRALR